MLKCCYRTNPQTRVCNIGSRNSLSRCSWTRKFICKFCHSWLYHCLRNRSKYCYWNSCQLFLFLLQRSGPSWKIY